MTVVLQAIAYGGLALVGLFLFVFCLVGFVLAMRAIAEEWKRG